MAKTTLSGKSHAFNQLKVEHRVYLIKLYVMPDMPEIKPAELAQLMRTQTPPFVLIDVRTPDEYRLEHIPAALSIPLAELESHLPRIQKLAHHRRVITYCATGARSYEALHILHNHHIEGMNLTGGFDAWWAYQQNPIVE